MYVNFIQRLLFVSDHMELKSESGVQSDSEHEPEQSEPGEPGESGDHDEARAEHAPDASELGEPMDAGRPRKVTCY